MLSLLQNRKFYIWANRGLLAAEGIAIGLVSGFVICCFRLTRDTLAPLLMEWLSHWRENWHVAPLWFVIVLCAAVFLGRLVRKVPLISGSGIPQTELVASGRLYISRYEWAKILPAKFIGCQVSTLCGLSLGREGPCIQMGAAAATLLSGLWEKFAFVGRIHVAAGAAAGMTAAFGSPIAGFLFVFEEMRTKITMGGVMVVMFAVVTAKMLTYYVFGYGLVFPFAEFPAPSSEALLPIASMGILMGVAGVLYNKALLGTKNAEALNTPLPHELRIVPPMLAAFALALFLPAVLGGGEDLVIELSHFEATPESVLKTMLVLAAVKILFSLFSYTGNVPGGILMPMLCIGALLGALCGQYFLSLGWIDAGQWQSFIIYGMVGFFVSMVRVPLTGAALVFEMSGATACILPMLVVAFISYFTANLLRCPPVYDSLRAAIAVPKRR